MTRRAGRITRGVLALAFGFLLSLPIDAQSLPDARSGQLISVGPIIPTGVSSNGEVVVGVPFFGPSFGRWTSEGGAQFIGGQFAGGRASVTVDGRLVLGSTLDADGAVSAALWSEATGWRSLGRVGSGTPCMGLASLPGDLSATGDLIVGQAFDGCGAQQAVAWSQDGSATDLGAIVPDRSSFATSVSPDGSIVAGWNEQRAGTRSGSTWLARNGQFDAPSWLESADGTFLGPVEDAGLGTLVGSSPCDGLPSAFARNPDGSTDCIGYTRILFPDAQLPIRTTAKATSDDGRVIGGVTGFSFTTDGVVWIDGVPRLLPFFLGTQGVDSSGWSLLAEVTAVSPDGRAIAGWGIGPSFGPEGFIAFLP